MKTKKLLISIVSVATACASTLTALVGCNNNSDDCQHVYTKSADSIAATCSAGGQDKYVCGICGDTYYVDTPINPDNHVYGDWEVTEPTAESTGKAVKTCTLNSAHATLTVDLPKLDGDGDGKYVVSTSKEVTVLEDGENTYTYANAEGDISFTKPVAAKGVNSVSDAVEAGVLSKSKVRRADGLINRETMDETATPTQWAFQYEFGDNCTYINDDSDYKEYYLSVDDSGEYYGIYVTHQNGGDDRYDEMTETEAAKYYNGMTYAFGRVSGQRFYGTEGLLEGLYTWAQTNANGDFEESMAEDEDGNTIYKFSFGDSTAGENFSIINVEFTLKNNYAVDTLNVSYRTYVNSYSETGNEVVRKITWEVYDSDKGYCRLVDPDSYNDADKYWTDVDELGSTVHYYIDDNMTHYYNELSIKQTTFDELPIEEEPLIENKYTKTSVCMQSFDMKVNNTILKTDEVNELSVATSYKLTLSNVLPTTAIYQFDNIKAYLRTGTGDRELSYDGSDYRFYINSTATTITLQSYVSGQATIVLKSRYVENVYTINFSSKAPSQLNCTAYIYSTSGYKWTEYATSTNSVTLYVGQPFYFLGSVPSSEVEYADPDYTAKIVGDTSYTSLYYKEGNVDDTVVSVFTAYKAGSYTLRLTSTRSSSLMRTITITVKEPPAENKILKGTYTATVKNLTTGTGEVTIAFNNSSKTVTLSLSDGSYEKFKYTYSDGTLTLEHSDGANGLEGFNLIVNEGYDLELSHVTKFNKTESVIISVGSALLQQ